MLALYKLLHLWLLSRYQVLQYCNKFLDQRRPIEILCLRLRVFKYCQNFLKLMLTLYKLLHVAFCLDTKYYSLASAASSLKITDRSFQYASPHLWNKLPVSLREPVSRTSFTSLCLSQPILLFSTFSIHHLFTLSL